MTKEQDDLLAQLFLEMYYKLLDHALRAKLTLPQAEEAVQDTFCIACDKIDELLESPNPKGWLVITLKYVAQNRKKAEANARALTEEHLLPGYKEKAVHEDRLSLRLLFSNVAHTEDFRMLVEYAVEGRTYLEIAQARGLSIAACKKRVQRAKEKLRKKIKL